MSAAKVASLLMLMSEILLITGFSLSVTVTTVEQVPVLLCASVVDHVMVVVPTGYPAPRGKLSLRVPVTLSVPVQLSVAECSWLNVYNIHLHQLYA